MDNSKKHILIIVGSTRKKSFNRQLAEAAAQMIGDRAEVSWLDFSKVPFIDQDIEFPPPEAVIQARNAIAAADGLWIFTPEYNHSIPGVLKNLLDWLSRPLSTDQGASSAIKGVLVTYSSAAGSSAGQYAKAQLKDLLRFIQCEVVDDIAVSVSLDRKAYTTDILTLAEQDKTALEMQIRNFLDHIRGN